MVHIILLIYFCVLISLIKVLSVHYRYGGADMIDTEKLYGLLPNYIPDYCLQPSNDESASHHWHSLIVQAYQKVTKSQ